MLMIVVDLHWSDGLQTNYAFADDFYELRLLEMIRVYVRNTVLKINYFKCVNKSNDLIDSGG